MECHRSGTPFGVARQDERVNVVVLADTHAPRRWKSCPARMRRRFPTADLVVFGHSHIPLDQTGAGLRIFNPGSPTDRRRQPHGTIGLLTIEAGTLAEAKIIPVT